MPLANTFDAILTEQLSTLFRDDILSRSKAYLLRELTSGAPPANQVAMALGMSHRTLQRRLGDLGLTYQNVLNETRHELSRRYLDDPAKSVTEIAFLLGFSEQSALPALLGAGAACRPQATASTSAPETSPSDIAAVNRIFGKN